MYDIYHEKEVADGTYTLSTVCESVSAEEALQFLKTHDDVAYQYIVAELGSTVDPYGTRDTVSRTRGDEWLEENKSAVEPSEVAPPATTTLSILDDGTRHIVIQAGLTSAHGSGPSAREAYCKADRDLRCKQRWGALHSLMDSTAPGCWDDWKRQVAQMQQTIDSLESEVARLICPF